MCHTNNCQPEISKCRPSDLYFFCHNSKLNERANCPLYCALGQVFVSFNWENKVQLKEIANKNKTTYVNNFITHPRLLQLFICMYQKLRYLFLNATTAYNSHRALIAVHVLLEYGIRYLHIAVIKCQCKYANMHVAIYKYTKDFRKKNQGLTYVHKIDDAIKYNAMMKLSFTHTRTCKMGM